MVRKGIGNRAGRRKGLFRRVASGKRQIKLATNFFNYACFLKKARKDFRAARGEMGGRQQPGKSGRDARRRGGIAPACRSQESLIFFGRATSGHVRIPATPLPVCVSSPVVSPGLCVANRFATGAVRRCPKFCGRCRWCCSRPAGGPDIRARRGPEPRRLL